MCVHMQLGFRLRPLLPLAGLAVVAAANLLLLGKDPGIVVACLLGFLLSPVLIRPLIRHQHRHQFRIRPDLKVEGRWTLTDEEVRSEGVGSQWKGDWTVFNRVLRLDDGFVVYTPARLFYWFPAAGFADPADLERLAQLARSKVSIYEDRRRRDKP